MQTHPRSSRHGFTILELILVVGMLAIIAAIVITAINPTSQLSATRDTKRVQEIRELKNALEQYIIDGNSVAGVPTGITNAEEICQNSVSEAGCTGTGFYLGFLTPNYIVDIPNDPTETGSILTGYYIYKSGSFNQICSPLITDTTNCGG